ncbi:MAG TPA: tyrosine-type recombinase/integrase [Dermatophilaceae bacterium]|nr:tyrosine-type recombinase/integrase [Dermatophilaceae bacterium]
MSRWLKEAREAAGLEWMTAHSWRETSATILDGSEFSARVIADQLGHSRVSMTQDAYLGRRALDPRVRTVLEGVDPGRRTKKGAKEGAEPPDG